MKLSPIDSYTHEHAYFAALAVLLGYADQLKEEEEMKHMQQVAVLVLPA